MQAQGKGGLQEGFTAYFWKISGYSWMKYVGVQLQAWQALFSAMVP